jgi:hypothetical protein
MIPAGARPQYFLSAGGEWRQKRHAPQRLLFRDAPQMASASSSDDLATAVDGYEAVTADSSYSLEASLKQSASVSKESRKRFEAESSRLLRKSMDLELEVDNLKKQAKRMRMDANEAKRLEESLQFDALWLALRRSDPGTTKLPCADNCPAGYARRVGQALKENSRVTEVVVHASKLLPGGMNSLDEGQILSFVSPLLGYIRTAAAVRSVLICSSHPDGDVNDFLMTQVLQAVFGNRERIEDLSCLRTSLWFFSLTACDPQCSRKLIFVSAVQNTTPRQR